MILLCDISYNSKISTTMESILTIQFTGRLCRSRFWSTYIVLFVISFILATLVTLAEGSSIAPIMTGLGFAFLFYLNLVQLGLGARRLHFTGLWKTLSVR